MERPIINQYQDPVEYMGDMINYLKSSEPGYSVHAHTKSLRRVSPALISLILQKKRNLTLDRVEEIAKLLRLNSSEKFFLKNWLDTDPAEDTPLNKDKPQTRKKEVGTHILNDWINIYVKDLFQIEEIQTHPEKVYLQLAHLASRSRIDRAIGFLLREGHLRKTLDGKIVIDTNLAVADPRISSKKIRQFHKGTLKIAKHALDIYPKEERLANSLIMPLNETSYDQLIELIEDFAENLKSFSEQNNEAGDRLYQLIVNLSPVGGNLK